MQQIPRWQAAEFVLTAAHGYDHPVQDAQVRVTFTAPTGRLRRVDAFWDGDNIWRVRFAPDEIGDWSAVTACSDTTNAGLHAQRLTLRAVEPVNDTPFSRHGPIAVAENGRHFIHQDGTPFFWLADTAWSGPLLSTSDEWQDYLSIRAEQGFTAVQWVGTTYLAAPGGDRNGLLPYTGREHIAIEPAFFQRLDGKAQAVAQAGLLNVPVLLWAAEWRPEPEINATNPGVDLPEDQAILLARYMVARWGAWPVVWILPGDGPYTGDRAGRWQRIGRAVFSEIDHAPVTLHPNGKSWYAAEFDAEPWLGFFGYQSGHGDDDEAVAWLVDGPPAHDWRHRRPRPVVNLEPAYEDHIAYQSGERFSDLAVRRRLNWSLLVSPTAGVSYGGHGVWGWDDGSAPPVNHPRTGIPRPWQEALRLPGAEQIRHLTDFFTDLPWWRLEPVPELVLAPADPTFTAARTVEGDLVVLYLPDARPVELDSAALPANLRATWVAPGSGERQQAHRRDETYSPPGSGDWWLLLQSVSDPESEVPAVR